jgi:two-component sensor histidine kinase
MYKNSTCSPTALQAEPLMLVEEINHRVFNEYAQAIASIRLAAKGLKSDEARDELASVASRLQLYADAHRAHQAPVGAYSADLAVYLETLCVAVMAARLEGRGVLLTFSATPVLLAAERCWLVALIVSEFITNSARHGLRGGAGNMRVELELDSSWVSCRVIDDGVPLKTPAPGRGMDIVTGLASALDGQAAWRFSARGTLAELIFPLHPEVENAGRVSSGSHWMTAQQINCSPTTIGNLS